MGVNVYIPKKQAQASPDAGLFQIGGAAVGGYFGGVGGATAGASAGGAAANILEPPQPGEQIQDVQTGGDAMSRRMNSLQQDPQMQIADSINSLKYIDDPQQRAELAKPLMQADYLARNKQA